MKQPDKTDSSLPIARVAGIEIRLDPSVLIIFGIIVFSLGMTVFPQWHPEWGAALIWGTALVSGVLFFISLLLHELAHSVVAQHYGFPVPRITLFLFGGMAEISQEADKPGVEFQIAIAGPVASLVISLLCSVLVSLAVADPALAESLANGEIAAITELGPVATALLWLGSVNMLLAVFNMIPGFPMDGGRVFRSIIWALTGDLVKATRWASMLGRIFGWTLIAYGVLTLVAGSLAGLWPILIGWFISNLARMSYVQMQTDRSLKGFRVSDLMNTAFDEVSAETDLPTFIDDCLLRSTQRVWPVVQGENLMGYAVLEDIVAIDPEHRRNQTVGDIARAANEMQTLQADTRAREALAALTHAEVEPVPVLSNGRLTGFLSRADVMRWMALHEIDH